MHQDHPGSSLRAAPPPEPLRWRLAVFAGYLLLALVYTWPLALHWQSGVIQKGDVPVDAGQGVWNLWWAGQALRLGQSPYLTGYLYYPLRIDLFWQTLSLPNALLVLPITLSAGPLAAFNALSLLSFALGGYFAYRLARAVASDRPAALAAGLVYAFSPYHMQRLLGGSLEVIAVQWIPLYGLLLARALHRRTVRGALAAAAALLLTTLASQYYGLFCAVFTAAYVALAAMLEWFRDKEQRTKNKEQNSAGCSLFSVLCSLRLRSGQALFSVLFYGLLIGLVWLLGLLPFVWPLDTLGAAAIADWRSRQLYHAAALVDFVMPNVLHPLWGGAAAAWHGGLHPFGVETGAAPGYIALALAGYGLLRRWRAAWPWLALALLMALFALGPELKIGEQSTGIPMPYALLNLLGPFRNSSRPSFIVAVMMLPVSMLVAFGVAALRASRPSPHFASFALQTPALQTLALLLLALELLVAPWPILAPRVAPLYAALRADPAPGAVLELPPRPDESPYMISQLCHGRPLAGGYLARTPDYPLLRSASTFRQLWYAERPAADIVAPDPAGELAALGIRAVALHHDQLGRGPQARLRALLDAPGIRRGMGDGTAEIYLVDPEAARAVALPAAGWYAPETDGQRAWRWMGRRATLRLLAPAPAVVTISFVASAYAAARPLEIAVDGRPASTFTIPAGADGTPIRLALNLPAGAHEMALRSSAAPAPDGRALSVSLSSLAVSAAPVPGAAAPPRPPVLPALEGPPCQ